MNLWGMPCVYEIKFLTVDCSVPLLRVSADMTLCVLERDSCVWS